ncbi:MAG: hypothetical protein K0R03_2220 [Moraxellaceae bacterium]|jgi:hypothetical protein|nr:hypothetical protein [Moraxellaceae bacterium]
MRTLIICIVAALMAAAAQAAEREPANDAKTVAGMSILGNNDAPKSLYIVPWKSTEIGVETRLSSSLDESAAPVDKAVFMRELGYYQASNP